MNTAKQSLKSFLKARANKVAQAKYRVEEAEAALVKAKKGVTYAEFW